MSAQLHSSNCIPNAFASDIGIYQTTMLIFDIAPTAISTSALVLHTNSQPSRKNASGQLGNRPAKISGKPAGKLRFPFQRVHQEGGNLDSAVGR
jgi:hypothetical protein